MASLKGNTYIRNIAEECEAYQKIYGANKNIARHVISVIDGLKPVERRVLYTMWASPSISTEKFSKVSSVSGAVMNFAHPHGEPDDVVTGLGQDWLNAIPYLDKTGNVGSADDFRTAAARYLEVRLSTFAKDCFFKDFDKRYVDMMETYSGNEEPEYLPSRYPVALRNSSFSGIGYGLASNVPGYNFKELCEAAIKLIKNPKAKIYFVPDSKLGCDVFDDDKCREGFYTGIGSVTYQARHKIDYAKNTVTFTSSVPQIQMKNVYAEISKMKLDGKLPELVDHYDESGKNGIKYVMIFKADANIDKILKSLFKSKVGLRNTLPIGLQMIDDYEARLYSIPEYLLTWIDNRRDQVRSMYSVKLVSAIEESHMNEIRLLVYSPENRQKTIDMAAKSENDNDYVRRLIKSYGITTVQATTLTEMRTKDWTKESYAKFKQRKKELVEEIAYYKKVLSDGTTVDEIIIQQLQDGIKKYGTERYSRIIYSGTSKKEPPKEALIAVSENGFIKRVPAMSKAVGKVTKVSGQKVMAIYGTTADKLLIFDENGFITRLPIDNLPEMKPSEMGVPVGRFTNLPGSKVVAVVKESDEWDPEDDKFDLVMVTEKGTIKKTHLSEFLKMKGERVAIPTSENDHLVAVIPARIDTDKDIVIYTDQGNGVRFDLQDIKTFSRTAKGSNYVSLGSGEKIIGADRIAPGYQYLFIITSSGKAKLTKLDYFPKMKKKDKVLSLASLGANESIVGVKSTDGNGSVRIYKKVSEPEDIEIKDIPVTTRVAKPTKIAKVPKGDSVIGFEFM